MKNETRVKTEIEKRSEEQLKSGWVYSVERAIGEHIDNPDYLNYCDLIQDTETGNWITDQPDEAELPSIFEKYEIDVDSILSYLTESEERYEEFNGDMVDYDIIEELQAQELVETGYVTKISM